MEASKTSVSGWLSVKYLFLGVVEAELGLHFKLVDPGREGGGFSYSHVREESLE